MRMKIRLYLLLSLFGMLRAAQAQDLHFSMFNMSPLTLNPALTGSFEGTARIGGIYRDQWASFLKNQYVTPSFYVDAPIIRGLRKQDWVGVGGMVFSDKAGTAELTNNGSMLSVAYHAGVGKDGKHRFTLGLQGGSIERRLDTKAQDLKFEDELSKDVGGGGLGFGNGKDRQLKDKATFFDINAGVMLRSILSEKDQSEVGLSFAHINSPKYALLNGQTDGSRRPMRIALHGRLNHRLSEKLYVEPTFLFQTTGGASEAAVQTLAGYTVNPDFTLRIGPGYRFGDAGQILLGLDYKQELRVGASYDVNLSSLSGVSKLQGGFEVAAYYIIKIYKKPKISPAILCPQL